MSVDTEWVQPQVPHCCGAMAQLITISLHEHRSRPGPHFGVGRLCSSTDWWSAVKPDWDHMAEWVRYLSSVSNFFSAALASLTPLQPFFHTARPSITFQYLHSLTHLSLSRSLISFLPFFQRHSDKFMFLDTVADRVWAPWGSVHKKQNAFLNHEHEITWKLAEYVCAWKKKGAIKLAKGSLWKRNTIGDALKAWSDVKVTIWLHKGSI